MAAIQPGLRHTVSALVLANFGRLPNPDRGGPALRPAAGGPVDRGSAQAGENAAIVPEKGSIILLVATDAPLDARQLRRLSLRAGAGTARTGSVFGHGSGDIALAFSTAYTVPQQAERPMPAIAMLHETRIDPLFEAAAEACEQAIIAALWQADGVLGRDGHHRAAIRDAAPDWRQWLADTEF